MNRELNDMFADFLNIYKLVNRETIIKTLQKELCGEKAIKIYSMTNGENSIREIGSAVGCSKNKVSSLWKQWSMAAIVELTERKGRVKAVFDLQEYGLSEIVDEED